MRRHHLGFNPSQPCIGLLAPSRVGASALHQTLTLASAVPGKLLSCSTAQRTQRTTMTPPRSLGESRPGSRRRTTCVLRVSCPSLLGGERACTGRPHQSPGQRALPRASLRTRTHWRPPGRGSLAPLRARLQGSAAPQPAQGRRRAAGTGAPGKPAAAGTPSSRSAASLHAMQSQSIGCLTYSHTECRLA